jgi:hypothetical protein
MPPGRRASQASLSLGRRSTRCRSLQVRAPDVQASVTVLGRGGFARPPEGDQGNRLDLHADDPWRAQLCGADLERADLRDAHLDRANLAGAYLEGADLADALGSGRTSAGYGSGRTSHAGFIRGRACPSTTRI